MVDFLVLGADGQQGSIISRFLLEKGYSVHGVDMFNFKLKRLRRYGQWSFELLDVMNGLKRVIKQNQPKVILNCMSMNTILRVARTCLAERIHCVDLGCGKLVTKRLFKLSKDFTQADTTYITGSGSVPGIGNVMIRHAVNQMDTVETIEMGFAWNSNTDDFVSPFCIASIFEEYTLPVEYLENGKFVKTYPVNTVHRRNFNFVGDIKTFQTTHQENFTVPFHYIKRGLKNFKFFAGFPDHSDAIIELFLKLGFNNGSLTINDLNMNKADVLSLLLKKPVPKRYQEWENLWATVEGTKGNRQIKKEMECHVPYRIDWHDAGCNIDTGFPTAIIGEMLLAGKITKRGAFSMDSANLVPIQGFFKSLGKEHISIFENNEAIN